MRAATSPSSGKRNGLALVCRIWKIGARRSQVVAFVPASSSAGVPELWG